MKKLILHIGYPRTGTTTLQNYFFSKLKNKINYLGTSQRKTSDYHNLVQRTLKPWITSKGKEGREELNLLLTDRLISGMNVLSEESLINSRSNPGSLFNPFKIKKLLGPICDSIDIVIVLRNQVDLIYSLYVHGISDKYGSPKNADKFIKKCLSNEDHRFFFSFLNVVNKYKSAFGKKNVHVFFFEDLLFDKDYYFSRWEKILNIPKEILVETLGDAHLHKRKRLPDGSYITEINNEPSIIKRFIKSFPFAHYIFSKLSRFTIVQKMSISTNRSVDEKLLVPAFTDEQKLRIKKDFFQDNFELLTIINSDEEKMKRYNYL